MILLEDNFVLANGVAIPKIGFGTWLMEAKQKCIKSVTCALKNGYRHIDTATDYNNESYVGEAINNYAIARDKLFITTKLSGDIKDVESARKCFEQSLKNLGLDYVDMYLIHSPLPWDEYDNPNANFDKENVNIWHYMEQLYREGKTRAIGVSNFSLHDLENITASCQIAPQANQICYYIGCTQPRVMEYCYQNKIQVIGHSPLAHGELLNNKEVSNIAQKYDKTIAQICVAFALQNNVLPLPKSTHEKYIVNNATIDFEIEKEDMEYLHSLKNTIPECEDDAL